MADQQCEVSSSGQWVDEGIKLVETLMMEDLKERLMRCNDARQLELLLKAVHLMKCKRCDDRYIQHIYPVQQIRWFFDWYRPEKF